MEALKIKEINAPINSPENIAAWEKIAQGNKETMELCNQLLKRDPGNEVFMEVKHKAELSLIRNNSYISQLKSLNLKS